MDPDATLVDLYHEDRRLAFIAKRLAALPAELAALDAEVARRLDVHRQREESAAELDEALRRLGRESQIRDEELARLQRQQRDVASVEALQASESALQRCQGLKDELEEKILLKLEAQEILARENQLRASREVVEAAALAAERDGLEQEAAECRREQEAAEKKRELLCSALEPALARRYQRASVSHGHRTLVPLQDSSCGGCGEALPLQQVIDVRSGGKVLSCQGCGRLVMRTEA